MHCKGVSMGRLVRAKHVLIMMLENEVPQHDESFEGAPERQEMPLPGSSTGSS